jgi:hypothetical protein
MYTYCNNPKKEYVSTNKTTMRKKTRRVADMDGSSDDYIILSKKGTSIRRCKL